MINNNNEQPTDDGHKMDDVDYEHHKENAPVLFNQEKLDSLIMRLKLTKTNVEVLGSILRKMNLVKPGTKTSFRYRSEKFLKCFKVSDMITYCCDIPGLLSEFGVTFNPTEWTLFIDSGKNSLKFAILNNEHDVHIRKPTLIVAYSCHHQESYASLEQVLKLVNYSYFKFNVCCDLKVVGLLSGIKSGFAKFQCFLCHFEGRQRHLHYVNHDWQQRHDVEPIGEFSIHADALVPRENIYLPPLHIKLGLFKQYVKAMDQSGVGFMYLDNKFKNKMSSNKIKEGIFIGTQIRELMNDENFTNILQGKELVAWRCLVDVVNNFLGKHRSRNYEELVRNMLKAFKDMDVKMNLKIHLMESHLDRFPPDMGSINDEHGERVHQDVSEFEKRFRGNLGPSFLADYCWMLQRPTVDWQIQTNKRNHF